MRSSKANAAARGTSSSRCASAAAWALRACSKSPEARTMTTYQSPVRDLQFVLHELLHVHETMQSCGRADVDAGTIDQVIAAAGEFASGVIAPLNLAGDREGCT